MPSSILGANADSLKLRPITAPNAAPAKNTAYQNASQYIVRFVCPIVQSQGRRAISRSRPIKSEAKGDRFSAGRQGEPAGDQWSLCSIESPVPMANPDYHRRQADMLTRLSKTARDPDTAAELLRLAAEHSAWARQGESPPSKQSQTRPPKPTKHTAA